MEVNETDKRESEQREVIKTDKSEQREVIETDKSETDKSEQREVIKTDKSETDKSEQRDESGIDMVTFQDDVGVEQAIALQADVVVNVSNVIEQTITLHEDVYIDSLLIEFYDFYPFQNA